MAEVEKASTSGVEVVAPRRARDTAEHPRYRPAQDQPEQDQIELALAALRSAAVGLPVSFSYNHERDEIVVLVRESGAERVLRQISTQEALRLAQLVRCGQQRLLDKLV